MLQLQALSTRYSIQIDEKVFLTLLDSESHATDNAAFKPGNQTLCERLRANTPAMDPDYNGHFGAHIVLTLGVEDDTAEARAAILEIIDDHLEWCQTLPLVKHVRERRAVEARTHRRLNLSGAR